MRLESVEDLEKLWKNILSERDPNKPCISICSGTGCQASGCEDVSAAFQTELEKRELVDWIDLKRTGCHGFCEKGTIVVIQPDDICYLHVKPQDVPDIVSQTIIDRKVIDRLLYIDPNTGEKIISESDIPFYRNQERIVFGDNRLIDPQDIEDYIALGGYSALAKALSKMSPGQVLNEVKKSNLRGRGGGGFPTGRKWETTARSPDEPKYVIINCDEGDPGAYMDRSLMEGNPHAVLEGLMIGAYAIGCSKGYVYIREEYPLAVKNAEIAIRQAREYGFLGRNILGTEFTFEVEVHRGAGAFVSGESSALMSAIEGKVGEPRSKYIHTAVQGLWGKPTCLNNVETWANIPLLINKGSKWFRGLGTKGSKGTKIFSLVGNISNTGLVEVPMGTSIRDIVEKVGGGIPNGKKLKAVQTGGPSGGCIPESQIDLPVDFDALSKAGSMMGSGGMIVMDEDTCMVDVARYFTKFLCDESCGKCLPCREGLREMLRILEYVSTGKATEEDLRFLEEIAEVVQKASLCALGQTAPNPVLSTLRHFREEYEAHLRGECPAGVCRELMRFHIDVQDCTGCGACKKKCPSGAISGKKKKPHIIDPEKCIKCGVCIEICKFGAISKVSGQSGVAPTAEIQEAETETGA